MNDATTDWTELRGFAEVDLLPGHSFYEEPRPAEGACYRPAVIEYPNCTQVSGQEKCDTDSIAASAGSLKDLFART